MNITSAELVRLQQLSTGFVKRKRVNKKPRRKSVTFAPVAENHLHIHDGVIEFVLPMRMICSTNSREHWSAVAKRAKVQRNAAWLYTRKVVIDCGIDCENANYEIKLVRIGKKLTDGDNTQTSMKYVRDGIAQALGIDDGDRKRCTWLYGEEIGREYGCRVRIEIK